MNFYPAVLTVMIVLGLVYYAYLSVDWTWLNPYNIKKGLVLGSVVRHEEWKERDKEQAEKADAEHVASMERIRKAEDLERITVNEGIQKMYEIVDEPVVEPIEATVRFFGGSDSTTKRKRIAPLDDGLNGVIGTIEGGVQPAPQEYLEKFSGRHAGAKLKVARKDADYETGH